jgi:hypothetical protein
MVYAIIFNPKINDYTEIFEELINKLEDNSIISLSEGNYYISRKIQIVNKSNLTIKGANSTIISEFDPKYGVAKYSGVFLFVNCRNIKLEGLIFDTSKPVNSAGKVTSIDLENSSMDIEVFNGCILDGNQTIFAVNSMDKDGSPNYLMAGYQILDYEVLSDKRVRVYCGEYQYIKDALKRINVGTQICFRYGLGGYKVLPNAMLTFYNCDDTVLYNITIHSSPGYATVVFPRCKNFTVDGYKVLCPTESNRLMASNVDGIHVLGLSGKLVMRNCYFYGLGDDALNIHSTAGYIVQKDENVISLQNKRFSIPLEADWCRKGDEIAIYSVDFIRKATLTVDEFDGEKIYYSSCDGEIEEGDFAANTSFYATVEIENCEVRNSRARAFVFQTENISVKNCKFFGMSGAAILMAPDIKVWHEMGPVKNVLIENCCFSKCGFSNMDSQNSAIVVRAAHDSNSVYPAGVHKNITIKNNRFFNTTKEPIYITATKGVNLSDNITEENTKSDYVVANCINFNAK